MTQFKTQFADAATNGTTTDRDEHALFAAEISDEALEAAACAGPEQVRAYTLAMCTGLQECPF